jgi:hypothetical protein
MTHPLARMIAHTSEPDPLGAHKLARDAWHEKAIVVIFPGDCTGLDRQFVDAVANRIYGKRGT